MTHPVPILPGPPSVSGQQEERAVRTTEQRRIEREAREQAEARRNAARAAELLARTEMTTYRNADGSYVGGEFAHVGELDWWDYDDEPVKVIGERWVLAERWEIEVPQHAVDRRAELEAEDPSDG